MKKLLRYLVNTILFVVLWGIQLFIVIGYSVAEVGVRPSGSIAIGGIVALIISFAIVKRINKSKLWARLFDETAKLKDEDKVDLFNDTDVVEEKKVEVEDSNIFTPKNITIAILLLICIPLFFNFFGEDKENDLINQNINGKVKEIIDSTFYAEVVFGEIKKDRVKALNKINYNKNGNVKEANYYNRDGSLWIKIKYKYDNENNRIELNRYNEEGEELTKRQYKFDVDGNIIEENQYTRASFEHSKATEIGEKITYKYDEDGSKTEENHYNTSWGSEDGSLDLKIKYKYDNEQNLIEINRYGGDGDKLTKVECKYDMDGNMIEKNEYNGDGGLIEKRTYVYNDGNRVKMTRYEDEDTDTWDFKHTFDKHKNWILEIQYDNDNAEYINERTITYYN